MYVIFAFMICNMFIYAGYDYLVGGVWPWSYVYSLRKWELWFYLAGVVSTVLLVVVGVVGKRAW